jgi:pyruvate kinase
MVSNRSGRRTISLILKIETARAVRHLPEIIVQAAGRQPTAIMIARGGLAVEIARGGLAVEIARGGLAVEIG